MVATYTRTNELGQLPPTFRQWQKRCYELRIPPVIGIAGSCGKSTTVRILQSIFNLAGVQSAIWTDFGVEINGRRQKGEISGWNRALARLTEGSLDIAIQELDWNLVSAVGLPRAMYPVIAITNLCGNSDACLQSPQGKLAVRALPRIGEAVHPNGQLCINSDDYELVTLLNNVDPPAVLVAKSESSPLLRKHHDAGGTTLWLRDGRHMVVGHRATSRDIGDMQRFPICRGDSATFQQSNVLIAAAAALTTGVGPDMIVQALTAFEPKPDVLPGSFSIRQVNGTRTIVDRLMPSWFLRSVLRAANPRAERRQITVMGGLSSLPHDDLFDVGRMLGRTHGALIHHGDVSESRLAEFKRGVAQNNFPPLLLQLPTERRAINRALGAVRAEDVLLFLVHGDPGPSLRAVARMT